ncbi:MAG TPA: ComEC/Rec2 family competence protein [Spirochaetota bacterium]|nr:ComEC/Rec2 family competence protein [Spirochaetota bacterium]
MTASGYLRCGVLGLMASGEFVVEVRDTTLVWLLTGGGLLFGLLCLAGRRFVPKQTWLRDVGIVFTLWAVFMGGWNCLLGGYQERDLAAHHWLVRDCTGHVREMVVKEKRTRLILEIDQALLINGQKKALSGCLVMFLENGSVAGVTNGSLVRVIGDVLPLPEGGPWAGFWKFLADRDVRGLIRRPEHLELLSGPADLRLALRTLRQHCDSWFESLGDTGMAFMKALVFGDRSGLGQEETKDFVDAGIIHVMAVSGMHIAVASAVLFWLARLVGVGRRFAWPCVMAILVIYAGLCGWTASVMRAVLMLGLLQIWKLVRSRVSLLDLLIVVAGLLWLEDRTVLGQPGYLLSFAATAGIILFAKPLTEFLQWLRLPRWLASTLGVSLAAQLAVIPILAGFFGRISLVSPLANCIFVPVILGLQAVGLVLSLAAFFGAGAWVASFFGTMIDLLYAAIHQAATLPWASLEIPEFPWWGVLAYTCLITGIIKGSERAVLGRRKNRGLALATQVAGILAREGDDGPARSGAEFSCQPAHPRAHCRYRSGSTRRRCA